MNFFLDASKYIAYVFLMSQKKQFARAVELLGGTKEAAKQLGISEFTVSAYRIGARRINPEVALLVEQLTGGVIPKESLVWGPPQAPVDAA